MSAPRLTPHQANMLGRLRSYSRDGRWVRLSDIGSRGAMSHLVEKGYAERKIETGPRGGTHESYRPRLAACFELDRRQAAHAAGHEVLRGEARSTNRDRTI